MDGGGARGAARPRRGALRLRSRAARGSSGGGSDRRDRPAGQGRHAHRDLPGRADGARPRHRLGGRVVEHRAAHVPDVPHLREQVGRGRHASWCPTSRPRSRRPTTAASRPTARSTRSTSRRASSSRQPISTEVTADDFKWSFERMMKEPLAPATFFYTGIVGAQDFVDGKAKDIEGYKVVDPYTGADHPREARRRVPHGHEHAVHLGHVQEVVRPGRQADQAQAARHRSRTSSPTGSRASPSPPRGTPTGPAPRGSGSTA